MYRILLFISIFIIGISSCKKEEIIEEVISPVLFEYEYTNFAWGVQHFGWMIDDENAVRGFSLPDNWNYPDEDGFLSEQELTENLAKSDTTYFSVEDYFLLKHYDERFNFEGAVIDTSDLQMADAGIGALYVYVWNIQLEKFKRVLLASRGDINMDNGHSQAGPAVTWLETIGKQTDRFFWFDD